MIDRNELEKLIISDLSNNNTINKIIQKYGNVEVVKWPGPNNLQYEKTEIHVGDEVLYIKSEDLIKTIINIFSKIITYYKSIEFIEMDEIGYSDEYFPYFIMGNKNIEFSFKYTQLIRGYSRLHIIPCTKLEKYISNGFLREEEIAFKLEKEARERSEKRTVLIAILSLILSLLGTIGTTLFNYFTYNNSREVIIKSMPPQDKPIQVIIKTEIEKEK